MDVEQAKKALPPAHAQHVVKWVPGRYRKIHPAWKDYIDDIGIGSFTGVIAYLEETDEEG